MPRNLLKFQISYLRLQRDILGRNVGRRSDGQCHRKSDRLLESQIASLKFQRVRVKRWCKRPPREAQATRHGKPRRVQGQIGNPGAARSAFRESETGFGYRSLRQMILSAARRRQNSAYSPSKTIFIFFRRFRGRTQIGSFFIFICVNPRNLRIKSLQTGCFFAIGNR